MRGLHVLIDPLRLEGDGISVAVDGSVDRGALGDVVLADDVTFGIAEGEG